MMTFEQVWGLELTSASRAAFLVQLTTVIVPVLEAVLRRQKLNPQVSHRWYPVTLAAAGLELCRSIRIAPSRTCALLCLVALCWLALSRPLVSTWMIPSAHGRCVSLRIWTVPVLEAFAETAEA